MLQVRLLRAILLVVSLKLIEFLAAICVLFCFFMVTGDRYWWFGRIRTIADTILGSVLAASIFEISTLYLPISSIILALCILIKRKWLTAIVSCATVSFFCASWVTVVYHHFQLSFW